jgi:hypothetical protein
VIDCRVSQSSIKNVQTHHQSFNHFIIAYMFLLVYDRVRTILK